MFGKPRLEDLDGFFWQVAASLSHVGRGHLGQRDLSSGRYGHVFWGRS